MILYC